MIDKLELLLALAREHFGHAAEKNGVTQQTLSAAVKQLEARFGVMLVRRGSRFQGFTPEGERVLEWARRIVGDARAMQQDVSAMRGHLEGPSAAGRNPDRAAEGGQADHAVSRKIPRREVFQCIPRPRTTCCNCWNRPIWMPG
ncbi:MAG: LysR family transcriptional regulator [Rhodospirillales bacterium]